MLIKSILFLAATFATQLSFAGNSKCPENIANIKGVTGNKGGTKFTIAWSSLQAICTEGSRGVVARKEQFKEINFGMSFEKVIGIKPDHSLVRALKVDQAFIETSLDGRLYLRLESDDGFTVEVEVQYVESTDPIKYVVFYPNGKNDDSTIHFSSKDTELMYPR